MKKREMPAKKYSKNPGTCNPAFLRLIKWLFRLSFYPKYHVHVDRSILKEYSEPYVLLFNHPSFYDPLIFAASMKKNIHFGVAEEYFYKEWLARLIHNYAGGFPKKLFQTDYNFMKNVFRCIENGKSVALSAEGRLSPDGTTEPIIAATVPLLKKLQVPVLLAKQHGTYLTKPKWAKDNRRGRIDITFQLLFSREECQQLSEESMLERLNAEMSYNEFQWAKEHDVHFKSRRMAEGLENILYICPKCGREYTLSTEGNRISCDACGMEAVLDDQYRFHSETAEVPAYINEWYDMQKRVEAERIQQPNFELREPVTLKVPDENGKGLRFAGQGETVLNTSTFSYYGTIDHEEVALNFSVASMPALCFAAGQNYENYANGTYYYYAPENKKSCAKWSITEELLHEQTKR